LGVDILFPEADRLSPPILARSLGDLPDPMAEAMARLPSSDSRLGDAFGELPAVLGAGPSTEKTTGATAPRRITLIRQVGGDPLPYLRAYASLIRTMPEIARTARSEAALTDDPDDDGLTRAVPLLTLAQGQLLPTFALEVLRVAFNIPLITVTTGFGGIENVE